MLGVVTGLDFERRAIGAALSVADVSISCAAGHQETAALAARELIGAGATALASVGIAGGLHPELKPGQVIVPHAVQKDHGSLQPVDARMRGRFLTLLARPVDETTLLSVASVLMTPAEKRTAAEVNLADAVDVESYAVVTEAAQADVPAIVVRVIADSADHRLPEAAGLPPRPNGKIDLWRATLSVMRRPADWLPAYRVGRATAAATKELRAIAPLLSRLVPG